MPLFGRLCLCILLILFGLTSWGLAQTNKASKKPCGSGEHDTQLEMNECAAREAKEADRTLNATFQKLLNKLKDDKVATAKVVAAENAWIAFRDAELAADWPVDERENPNARYGSVHPFCYYEELASMTRERVRKLRMYMLHEEGDVCAYGP
jgi:uncharacterized protein YecT (DUF1311 family)